MIALEWASTLLSFAGTAMIAHRLHQGWALCLVADIGFVVFAFRKKLYGFLGLCLGYGVLNLIGWLN